MILKKFPSLLLTTLLFAGLHAEETVSASVVTEKSQDEGLSEVDLTDKEAEKIALLSESFGHIIAKHIESLGVDFDLARLVKGLQDANQGKIAPMGDAECIEAITKARQKSFDILAASNLEKASDFMKENVKHANITVLEDGKLHVRIEQEGTGLTVEEGNSPVIRYVGKFIDGSVFGASKEDDVVILDETIPGFGRGLIGMKEGEKRTLFIHPDMAYGTMGQLPPNSLLIFEIELVKANAESGKEVAAPIVNDDVSPVEKEIAINELSDEEMIKQADIQ